MVDAPVPETRRKKKKENQVEILVCKLKEIRGKCWVKGGGRIGQDKVEERYSTPFRRRQMMGKDRGEEDVLIILLWTACLLNAR